MRSIRGIIPPLITPLRSFEELDARGLEQLVAHLLGGGVNGVFVLGTTGEASSLSMRRKQELIERVERLLSGSVPLLVGVLDNALETALELAWWAADHGAEAVIVAPPCYLSIGQEEVVSWYEEFAARAPLPLLLYNMPECTRIWMEPETIRRLTQHENIIGIKDSSGDLVYFRRVLGMVRRERPEWAVLMGPEELLAEALVAGADGGTPGGANLAPALFRQLYDAHAQQRADELAVLRSLVAVLAELYALGGPNTGYLRVLKAALEDCGLCSGVLAPPLVPLEQNERAEIRRRLEPLQALGYVPLTVTTRVPS